MKITELKEPLAIAMWDSSWLRRRYAGGGFDDFDRALTELVDRGYNAVRIDVFPHMIANAPDGTNSDRFLDPAGFAFSWYGFAQWGSPWTVYIHPRRDLLAFLKCCEKHGVYVLLSTWLKPTAEPRNEWLEGPEDLVRIWNETLEFLRENNSLGQVIGVDISNEMPNGASNKQFNTKMNSYTDPAEKTSFFRGYFSKALCALRSMWPDIPFAASHTVEFFGINRDMEFPEYDFLDVHIWAEFSNFMKGTRYASAIGCFGLNMMPKDPAPGHVYHGTRLMPPDVDFERVNDEILESWNKNRSMCVEHMESCAAFAAEKGKKYGIPVGCTEGWGTVTWVEHPLLSWDMVKDAALVGAELGRKYGFKFNCQSNFCEPQFVSLWRDVEHHRQVTDIIRGRK